MSRVKSVLMLLIGLTFVSCSSRKTISASELRSEILAATSLASETELLIQQQEEGRITESFAKGHLSYLLRESTRSAIELREKQPSRRLAGALEKCDAQLRSLIALLSDLTREVDDKERLPASQQEAARIRMVLEHAKDEL